jgi:hypothetical protein
MIQNNIRSLKKKNSVNKIVSNNIYIEKQFMNSTFLKNLIPPTKYDVTLEQLHYNKDTFDFKKYLDFKTNTSDLVDFIQKTKCKITIDQCVTILSLLYQGNTSQIKQSFKTIKRNKKKNRDLLYKFKKPIPLKKRKKLEEKGELEPFEYIRKEDQLEEFKDKIEKEMKKKNEEKNEEKKEDEKPENVDVMQAMNERIKSYKCYLKDATLGKKMTDRDIDIYIQNRYLPALKKEAPIKKCYECFNEKVLEYIINNRERFCEVYKRDAYKEEYIWNILRVYQKLSIDGIFEVYYSRTGCGNIIGRLQAFKALALQNFPREIRTLLCMKIYRDVDIVNCHPTILHYLCTKYKIECGLLQKYINNREKYLTELKDVNKISRDDAKTIVIAMLNGSKSSYKNLKVKTEFITELYTNMERIKYKICENYLDLYEQVKKDHKKYKKNGGKNYVNSAVTTLSKVLRHMEALILNKMLEYFKNIELLGNFQVLIFDGFFVTTEENLLDKQVKDCEDYIEHDLGIKIKLKIKPIKDNKDFFGNFERHFNPKDIKVYEKALSNKKKDKGKNWFKKGRDKFFENRDLEIRAQYPQRRPEEEEKQEEKKQEYPQDRPYNKKFKSFTSYRKLQKKPHTLNEIFDYFRQTIVKIDGESQILLRKLRRVQYLSCDVLDVKRKVVSYVWDSGLQKKVFNETFDVEVAVKFEVRLLDIPFAAKIVKKNHDRHQKDIDNEIPGAEEKEVPPSYLKLSELLKHCLLRGKVIRSYDMCNFIPVKNEEHFNKERIFNSFEGFYFKEYKKKKDIIFENTAIYRLMKNGISGNNKEVFKFIRFWIAHLIQKTHTKPDIALVLGSIPGCGKSMFSTFLLNVIGKSYSMIFEPDKACAVFNKSEANKLFLVFEEPQGARVKADWNQYKTIITRKTISIRPMYGEVYVQNDYCRALFLSNNLMNIPFDTNGRRLFATQCSDVYKGNYAFFEKVNDEIHSKEILKAAFDYFSNINIDKFVPQRDYPRTELQADAKENQMNPVHKFMIDLGSVIANNNHSNDFIRIEQVYKGPRDNKYKFKISDLHKIYEYWCCKRRLKNVCNRDRFKIAVQELGLKFQKSTLYIERSRFSGFSFTIEVLEKCIRTYIQDKSFKFKIDINPKELNDYGEEVLLKPILRQKKGDYFEDIDDSIFNRIIEEKKEVIKQKVKSVEPKKEKEVIKQKVKSVEPKKEKEVIKQKVKSVEPKKEKEEEEKKEEVIKKKVKSVEPKKEKEEDEDEEEERNMSQHSDYSNNNYILDHQEEEEEKKEEVIKKQVKSVEPKKVQKIVKKQSKLNIFNQKIPENIEEAIKKYEVKSVSSGKNRWKGFVFYNIKGFPCGIVHRASKNYITHNIEKNEAFIKCRSNKCSNFYKHIRLKNPQNNHNEPLTFSEKKMIELGLESSDDEQ